MSGINWQLGPGAARAIYTILYYKRSKYKSMEDQHYAGSDRQMDHMCAGGRKHE